MIRLLLTTLLYRRTALLAANSALAASGLFLSLRLADGEAVPRSISLVVLAVGMVLVMWNFSRELQERQLLNWLALPVSLRTIQLARYLVPAILLASLLLTATGAILLRAVWQPLPALGSVAGHLLGIHAVILTFVYILYASEEVCLLLRSSKLALVAVNVVAIGLMVLLVSWGQEGQLPPLSSPAGLLTHYALAFAFGGAGWALSIRRGSYLVGISPIHGFPEDWSEAPSERRR